MLTQSYFYQKLFLGEMYVSYARSFYNINYILTYEFKIDFIIILF